MILSLIVDKGHFPKTINFCIDNRISATVSVSGQDKFYLHIVESGRDIIIKKKRYWLTYYYEITFSDLELYRIKSIGGFKTNYIFEFCILKYLLYVHKGLFTSIFLNGKQLGYIHKKEKILNNQISYQIVTNDDVDLAVVYCLSLVIYASSISVFDETSDVEIDFGNIGPEEFPFDSNWKPNVS